MRSSSPARDVLWLTFNPACEYRLRRAKASEAGFRKSILATIVRRDLNRRTFLISKVPDPDRASECKFALAFVFLHTSDDECDEVLALADGADEARRRRGHANLAGGWV